ncbi:uncharacterized protein LOC101212974 isoform X1 [Cucumis sativus]|uniref:RING-type domain-containing protein n=1 Tax=Cucumis sativus TaxID=3659 RepID=A0A0A0M066_CUCSA|nr:uncharacterized protein LOC101212974 isoform X1 [Cucumis sativus]KGN65591.1 hypothetical protein Csa_019976 [Cucumis sativus]
MEFPECPVCLQTYDGESIVPRVLSCGHSACGTCLENLPQRFPETIRCPACNVLVKFPSQGASALPKNIDLLRLCPEPNAGELVSKKSVKRSINQTHEFFPRLWSDEFYRAWKHWVLPHDAVSIERCDGVDGVEKLLLGRICPVSDSSFPITVGEDRTVSLVRIVSLPCSNNDCLFKFSYTSMVLKCLNELKDEEKNELGLILRAGFVNGGRVCRTFGLWGNLEDGFLYLVCERRNDNLLEMINNWIKKLDFRNKVCLNKDDLLSFAVIATELCDAIIAMHSLRLSTGFLSLSCFSLGVFGSVCVDINGVLVMGRTVCETVIEAVSSGSKLHMKELGMLTSNLIKKEAFVPPEVLLKLLNKEDVGLECSTTLCSVGNKCDIWSLVLVLLSLLLGKDCFEETLGSVEESHSDCSAFYGSWVEKVSSCLDTKFGLGYASLKQTLCRSLDFDPENRPHVVELLRCCRELIVSSELDALASLKLGVNESGSESGDHCLVLGDLIRLPDKLIETHRDDMDQITEEKTTKKFVDGISVGMVKSRDMLGHRDSVTGLVIGGDYLFSSSYDKTVQAWSLQDFSHVHTFIGHEHRIMDLVYIDEEQPLCVSADIGGGIYVWSVALPLKQDPLKKWYEEKDWRYDGIHALAYSSNGYLYTGGGDKLVKEWSLKDGTLSGSMHGHKSVVSALVASNGVLYSGSWDGAIRLWSLANRSQLAVLGEESSGSLGSVLRLAAKMNILVATHENGSIKVWRNDVFMKTMKLHDGAIFATSMLGKQLVTGGRDKAVNVQELFDNELEIDCRHLGSIPTNSTITALLCWEDKLYVGYADRCIKVYYYGK